MDFKTGLEGKPWWHGLVAGGVAGALFFGLLFWWLLNPMRKDLEGLKNDLAAKQQKILEGRAAQQQLPQFRKEVQDLELELDKLLKILPARRKTADLLRRIRSLAEEGNLTLKRFTPAPLAEREFYSEFPIEIEVNGTYHNLAMFFDDIGRYSRIVNIEKLHIDAVGKGPQTIHSSFIAKTFVAKPPEPPAEGEEGAGGGVTTAGGPLTAPPSGGPS